MKNVYLWLFVTTLLLGASSLKSAEVIPIWNKTIEAGSINDMELLKGGEEILIISGNWDKGQIQLRSVVDGELRNSRPANLDNNCKIIITPDSTKFILLNGGVCELRNFDDNFSIVKSFILDLLFTNIAIDPIRPYVYVTGAQMRAYNYETGELIKEFTGYIADVDTRIAVSEDGKYLATLNDGKAYLKVWDLEKMEQIRDVQLWDDKLPNADWWCDSKDIQFSKLNSDVVYYSGNFPSLDKETKQNNGLRKFNISLNLNSENIQERPLSGKFIIFDKGERSLIYSYGTMFFYNFSSKIQEFYNKPPNNIFVGGKTIFNEKNNFFIGFSGSNICKFLFDRETNLESEFDQEIIISPNPTNSFVNINLNCNQQTINYQINNSNGILILQNTIANETNNLRLDFTPYPSGVYFITINCNLPKTYKIIKES